MDPKILPYTSPQGSRDLLPPLTGRMVRIEKNVYTDASRILGALRSEQNPQYVSIHRQISNGDIMETYIKGNLKRIANKISKAKTTSGRSIDLFPLKERFFDSIKIFLRKR